MPERDDVEYKVILVFPGFGEERENAEQIVEAALDYLNTHRDKPGFRFAPYVTAQLEIVANVEQAMALLDTGDAVAMMILHDLSEYNRSALLHECSSRTISLCKTEPAMDEVDRPPQPPEKGHGWRFVLQKRPDDEPPTHTIPETTLTASLEGAAEEVTERVQQLIAVMALGVMQYDYSQRHPALPMEG